MKMKRKKMMTTKNKMKARSKNVLTRKKIDIRQGEKDYNKWMGQLKNDKE